MTERSIQPVELLVGHIPLDNLLNKMFLCFVWPILKGFTCIDQHMERGSYRATA